MELVDEALDLSMALVDLRAFHEAGALVPVQVVAADGVKRGLAVLDLDALTAREAAEAVAVGHDHGAAGLEELRKLGIVDLGAGDHDARAEGEFLLGLALFDLGERLLEVREDQVVRADLAHELDDVELIAGNGRVGQLAEVADLGDDIAQLVELLDGRAHGGIGGVHAVALGKLVNDRYPGSAINVLQGASVSNPLRLEQNAADVTLTQTFNTVAARDGKAPYKKPLKNVASLANMNDTSRLSIIVSADLPVNTFDELMEKKLPVRLDRGAKGTLHNVVGAMLLAEYGYTYDDITKWGGAHTAVSANDRVGMFQDGTLNAYLTLGPGQQSHIQELVLNAKVKWLPVSDKVLKSVTAKTGQSIGVIPADFYGGAVGRDIPCITDSTVMLVRKNMPDADVYKITKAIVEGFEELHAVQPTWKTLVPEHMADNLALPLHPGAEKYYREAGIIK